MPEDQTENSVPFEKALEELEALVARMETGKLPLEELMKDFEAGSRLVKRCRSQLDTLERKIELLTRDDGGDGQWCDFEADAATNRAAPPSSPDALL